MKEYLLLLSVILSACREGGRGALGANCLCGHVWWRYLITQHAKHLFTLFPEQSPRLWMHLYKTLPFYYAAPFARCLLCVLFFSGSYGALQEHSKQPTPPRTKGVCPMLGCKLLDTSETLIIILVGQWHPKLRHPLPSKKKKHERRINKVFHRHKKKKNGSVQVWSIDGRRRVRLRQNTQPRGPVTNLFKHLAPFYNYGTLIQQIESLLPKVIWEDL